MINIHNRLWVVKGYERKVEDSTFLLAYMTHTEHTKEGSVTKSFASRQDTGLSWAKPRSSGKWVDGKFIENKIDYTPDIQEFDNSPATGFRVVGSASRWSTDNKVIRVEDPRGFVVEIPTSNLTTLLKHTIVDHGEVKEACVWGREANNHILLPVNSEVYQQAVTQTIQHNTKVPFTKLKIGQIVRFSVDDKREFIYLGRGKAVWEIHTKQAKLVKDTWYYSQRYQWHETDLSISDPKTLEDNKWCFIFKNKVQSDKYNAWDNWEYKTSGQCVVVGETGEEHKVETFQITLPERVRPKGWNDKYGLYSMGDGKYNTATTKEIKMKEESNV